MNRLLILLISLVFAYCESVYAQSVTTTSDRDWQIEVEPSAFALKGFSIHVGRNLTRDNKLSTAFYALATDVPNALQQRIFQNTDEDDLLRVGLQVTLNTRYTLELLKGRQSNPFVGLVTGWEYFTLTHPDKDDLRVDVILLTPYLGWKVFLYKDLLYVNPQLRSVLYLNPQYSVANREETINKVFLLPQVSVGLSL